MERTAAARRRVRKLHIEEVTKVAVRDAVIRILSREGSAALTMENVAAEAGMAKGTLYLYFRGKQQLLEWVKDRSMEPLGKDLSEILAQSMSPSDRLRALIARHLCYFDENRGFFRVLLLERHLAQAHLKRRQSSRFQAYIDGVAALLDEGVRRGVFRAIDPAKVALLLVESIVALVETRLWNDAPPPVAEDARLVADVFLRGLSAEKGGCAG